MAMNEEQFDDLIRLGRAHRSGDVSRAAFGLETRVAARLRVLGEAGESASLLFWEDLRKCAWGSALGVAPAVVLMVIWLCVWSGFSAAPFAYDAIGDLFSMFL